MLDVEEDEDIALRFSQPWLWRVLSPGV
jgi:hypothetical protein